MGLVIGIQGGDGGGGRSGQVRCLILYIACYFLLDINNASNT